MDREIRFDCAHYRGSRPCAPHKKHGVICSACEYYTVVRERLAVIKLGAMGDVLRTAALLPDIRASHPEAEIIWITLPESAALLAAVEGVDRIVVASESPLIGLFGEFDWLYNFDNADEGVALAKSIPTKGRRGFKAGASGHCEGVYEGGDSRLFELGLWDDLKRQNTTSYLTMLAATAGLKYSGHRPKLRRPGTYAPELRDKKSASGRQSIGINTDAGTRWLRKQWNLPYVEQAVDMFVADGYDVVLFGGAALQPFNDSLANRLPGRVTSAKTAGDIDALVQAIAQIDVLLTGDTLAMHIAWALDVPTVALFGPTSSAEIDLAAADVKLFADNLNCLGCYLHTCDINPHCMDRLTPDLVVNAVKSRLLAANEVPVS